MKKIALLLAVVFFTSIAYSQEQATSNQAVEQSTNGPQISFDKLTHEYGTVYKEGDGNCEFKFTNTGNEPLVLSTVRSSCGCTVPKWPREPVLPGKSAVISVKYDTRRMGTINKSITVISNAKTSTVTLYIKGKVVPKPVETIPEKTPGVGATPENK